MRRLLVLLLLLACSRATKPSWPHHDFKEVTVDVFAGMSSQGRPVAFTKEQLQGRILWNLWSGDNAAFWNWMAQHGLGTSDLLKVVTWPRDGRFEKFGVMNQPGFARPVKPDQFGLYIDIPKDERYDIDKHIDAKTYGRSSGVMGLRLFPNPKFDSAKWDPKRYYSDRTYFERADLERPYLVGMACSFCHVGPDPVNPPANVDEPEYANLSDYVGQHYFKVAEVFAQDLKRDNFIKQLLLSNPPGTLDTSFIATDYLNNPGTMNGIYEIPGRVQAATAEEVTGGALNLRNREPIMPRVLKDGADSVGVHAALSRVHVNIGTYWEEWIRNFHPLIGIREQTPFDVKNAQENSPHWNWSESRSPALAAYFIAIAKPHKLADAPGGAKWIDKKLLARGQQVFAENCAKCHSSKLVEEALRPDFIDGNFLGNEQRYPVTKIGTNAARAVASNALRGHVWDNFSSETYKTLPAVGTIKGYDGKQWTVPGGGRGYYRPPSLIGVWASAPFLHHNTLGTHVHAVDVDSRLRAFNDAIEKLLWPEKRTGVVWRTSEVSYLEIPESQLRSRLLRWALREHLRDGEFVIGPIPKDMPVNLLANTDLEIDSIDKARQLGRLLIHVKKVLDEKRDPKELVPDLIALSACPDFEEDKGHHFGTDLPDADKRALIEFVKTF
jgi:hypothetical protein